jgi:hypothetical protein
MITLILLLFSFSLRDLRIVRGLCHTSVICTFPNLNLNPLDPLPSQPTRDVMSWISDPAQPSRSETLHQEKKIPRGKRVLRATQHMRTTQPYTFARLHARGTR